MTETYKFVSLIVKYFNSATIAAFFRIPLAWFRVDWATVFHLILKDLKSLVFKISLLKLVVLSLE